MVPDSGLEIASAQQGKERPHIASRSYLAKDPDELKQLGVPDAGGWTVLSNPENVESMAIIAAALKTYKYTGGLSVRETDFSCGLEKTESFADG